LRCIRLVTWITKFGIPMVIACAPWQHRREWLVQIK
jgi:hypothetical protein